jgi:predicted nucleotidyltransferase
MREVLVGDDPKLRRLVEQIVDRLDPVAVYLFGSRATGTARRDSDYDLLIVVDDDAPPERSSMRAAYRLIDTRQAPADLLVMRRSLFEHDRSEVGTVSHVVAREGRVLHER